MPESTEIRRLTAKWRAGAAWPKRLEWVKIRGLRGWSDKRFDFGYPIMAVTGENGVGKSTVLQAAASVYRSGKPWFASDFFPDTCWDKITSAEIEYQVREGSRKVSATIRKPTERWYGNPDRPLRDVIYVDLSRIQPIPARVGFNKIVKGPHFEKSAMPYDSTRLSRFSQIMGRPYELAKMAITNMHATREVPVIGHHGFAYSGFHQGAGETMIAELLKTDWPKYSLVLIDEIETSLHPRAQRRLVHDIAERCRELELQVIFTTHSSYILDELPPEARAYVMQVGSSLEIMYGVSSAFAMTKMDEVPTYECDLYVEDDRAKYMLTEIIVSHAKTLAGRCRVIPYGTASVGQALGQMVFNRRFPTPSCVFLDGDQGDAPGCVLLPGEDAPERVVFDALRAKNWQGLSQRVGRAFSNVADACNRAMILKSHHDWLDRAATDLTLSTDILWQAMCSEWASSCLASEEARKVTQPIEDIVAGLELAPIPAVRADRGSGRATVPDSTLSEPSDDPSIASLPLFSRSLDAELQ
jgi:predicted ATPase